MISFLEVNQHNTTVTSDRTDITQRVQNPKRTVNMPFEETSIRSAQSFEFERTYSHSDLGGGEFGSRIGSSHGVIRGSTIRMSTDLGQTVSSGRAIGRLNSIVGSQGDGAIPRPPTVSSTGSRSAGNYFGSVGSRQQPPGNNATGVTLQPSPSATASHDFQPGWDTDSFKTRLTLASPRSGVRQRSVITDADSVNASTESSIAEALIPTHVQEELKRRSSLISSALGQTKRPDAQQVITDRTRALLDKQDKLRNGGGAVPSSRSSFCGALPQQATSTSTTSAAPVAANLSIGQSGFQSRPTTSGGSVAPVNPLIHRNSTVGTNSAPKGPPRTVGVLRGAPRRSSNDGLMTAVGPSDGGTESEPLESQKVVEASPSGGCCS